MYMSSGARRCSVQSPPTVYARHCQYLSAVAVNICRLSLSISVGCRCQNLTLSPLSIFATAIIVQSWQSMQLLQLLQVPQAKQYAICDARYGSHAVAIEC